MRVVRHISGTATDDNLTTTPVDLSEVLKLLGNDFIDQLSAEHLETSRLFNEFRDDVENYTEHLAAIPNMTDDQNDECGIAEQYARAHGGNHVRGTASFGHLNDDIVPFELHWSRGNFQILHTRL
nr:unnamed protein product [Haemonchus contortus]